MSVAAVSLSLNLIAGPTMDSKTIEVLGQVVIGSGTYTTGGLAMGLVALADNLTIDANAFLRCQVWGEDVITLSPAVGQYIYHYSPTGDVLQILFRDGTELENGASIPAAVLNDTVLFEARWNRL